MAIHFVFIVVIVYVLGKFMEKTLPSRGWIGKILNPGPVGLSRPFARHLWVFLTVWIPNVAPLLF